ncbi:hypothetical protein HNR62_001082 [Oceanisphaera litoralis]|uniref:hypothetical protein n=1 Tax=Oceanisphaera litoralis TaxID=225144 RepID=UPI00195DF130|nr:hypothetical protein [Oceanisphaera litoralis]MBM7455222.1 hypothetical protein [Oceanisphaera litoralis]
MEQLDWVQDEELIRELVATVKSDTLSGAAKLAAVAKLLAPLGVEIPEPPSAPGFTATDIGKDLGLSAQAIGRLANKHRLKDERHGEFRLSQSRHSAKQVETFIYNEQGRQALQRIAQAQAQPA